MPKIKFPDGKEKNYNEGITGFQIASDISSSLAKESVAIIVNGNQKDLSDPILYDSSVNFSYSLKNC